MNSKENKKIKFLTVCFMVLIGFTSVIYNVYSSKPTEIKK